MNTQFSDLVANNKDVINTISGHDSFKNIDIKPYVEGLLFYKHLCDQQVKTLIGAGVCATEVQNVTENDTEFVELLLHTQGYFVGYENLFWSWIDLGVDFSIENFLVSFSAFSRLSSLSVFDNLLVDSKRLGETSKQKTMIIRRLIYLIADIK